MLVWAKAWRTSGSARGLQRLDPPDLALGCLRPLPRARAEGPGASHSGRRTWTGRTSSSSGRRSSRPGKASASTGAPTCRSGTSHPVASQRPTGSDVWPQRRFSACCDCVDNLATRQKSENRHKAKHTGRARAVTSEYRSRSRRLTPSGIAVAGGGESVARETEPQRIPFGAAWQAGVASDTRKLQLYLRPVCFASDVLYI